MVPAIFSGGVRRGRGNVRRAAAIAPDSLPVEDVSIVSYMAPEQALGGETDGRADLFSLGTLLYEMLTGRNPFAAATVIDTAMNVVRLTPPPPSSLQPEIPAELDAIVGRALAKDLQVRFQSAASFSAELRKVAAALDVRVERHTDDYLLPVDDEADKVPAMVWVAAGGGVAILAAVLWWGFMR